MGYNPWKLLGKSGAYGGGLVIQNVRKMNVDSRTFRRKRRKGTPETDVQKGFSSEEGALREEVHFSHADDTCGVRHSISSLSGRHCIGERTVWMIPKDVWTIGWQVLSLVKSRYQLCDRGIRRGDDYNRATHGNTPLPVLEGSNQQNISRKRDYAAILMDGHLSADWHRFQKPR